MRFGIGMRLGFWLALLGILSTGLTGYYAYHQSREMLIDSSKDKLLTATRVLAHRFTYTMTAEAEDIRFLAALPSLKALGADHDTAGWQLHRQQVEDVMSSLMHSHPEYFQIRLIGIDHYGKEMVRVDKDAAGVVVVSDKGLQEKSHFPYFFRTLRLSPGEIYFSNMSLNKEQGAHAGLDQPTLRIATPVKSESGNVFGIVVINVDLDSLFELIRTDVPNGINVMVANQDGDYIVHPIAAKTFGFDKGTRYRIQNDITSTKTLLEEDKIDHLVLNTDDVTSPNHASVAAFVKVPFPAAAEQKFVLIGLMIPLENVLQESRILGFNMIQITAFFSLLAIAIALVLSRILAKPLNQMTGAVSRFAAGMPMVGLPIEREDEIGELARNFQSMAFRLNARVDELEFSQEQLGSLAYYDQLTGLPNRLLFLDRLKQAILKAQRNRSRFAVMFIDLDKFKEVNDSYGHAAGDDVLKIAASRMQQCIRHADTIARLAGDEFTILIEEIASPSDVTRVAQKIIAFFEQPFLAGGHELYLTCSLGISLYPNDGLQAEELLDFADAAMYQAKALGRNAYRFYARRNNALAE